MARLRIYKERRPSRWLWLLAPLAVLLGAGLMWWHDSAPRAAAHTVQVALLTPDGAPAPGTPVLGLIDTAAVPVGEWAGFASQTDAGGVCAFSGVAPGSYWLRAQGITFAVDVPPTAPDVLRLALTLAPDGYDVSLRLLSPDGSPLAGVAVLPAAFGLEGTGEAAGAGETDWQGDFIWRGAPAGAHRIEVPGYVPAPLIVEPGENKSPRLQLTLYPDDGTRYRRTVSLQKSSGAPLANASAARVAYSVPSGKEVALETFTADGEGRIMLDSLAPGEHTLRVGTRRFKLAVLPGEAPEGEATFRL